MVGEQLWKTAAKALCSDLESLVGLLNETLGKDRPLPMPPSVTLYKLTVRALEAAESGDVETLQNALREAKELVNG